MERVFCLLIGYAFGMIQTGYLIGRFYHQDIREHGSGNAGSTNALRVFGLKAGILTLLGDVLKCVAAVLVCRLLFGSSHADIFMLLKMYCAAGVILGHSFPVFMGFRGGKGVAASLGLAIVLDWKILLIILAVFIGVVLVTRYVSLGSLSAYVAGLASLIFFGQHGYYRMEQRYLNEMYLVLLMLTILVFIRHRQNIVRLLHGQENKISVGKKDTGRKGDR